MKIINKDHIELLGNAVGGEWKLIRYFNDKLFIHGWLPQIQVYIEILNNKWHFEIIQMGVLEFKKKFKTKSLEEGIQKLRPLVIKLGKKASKRLEYLKSENDMWLTYFEDAPQ